MLNTKCLFVVFHLVFISVHFTFIFSMEKNLVKPAIKEKIELISRDPEVHLVIDAELRTHCPFLLSAIEFQKKMAPNSPVRLDGLNKFSPEILMKFIESLSLRADKKELHPLFDYNDLELPIDLADLAHFIDDQDLLDTCAFAFTATFVQPVVCQNIEDGGCIKSIASLAPRFDKFKDKAARYLRQRMGTPLRIYEFEGNRAYFRKFSPDCSVIALEDRKNILLINALSGKILHRLQDPSLNLNSCGPMSFNATSDRLILGQSDSALCEPKIFIWDVCTGELLTKWNLEDLNFKISHLSNIYETLSGDKLVIDLDSGREASRRPYVVCLWDQRTKCLMNLWKGRLVGHNETQEVYVVFEYPDNYNAFDASTGKSISILSESDFNDYQPDDYEKVLIRKSEQFPGDVEYEEGDVFFEIWCSKRKIRLGFIKKIYERLHSSLGSVQAKDPEQSYFIFRYQGENVLELWKRDQDCDYYHAYTLKEMDGKAKGGQFYVEIVGEGKLLTRYDKSPDLMTDTLWDLSKKRICNRWKIQNSDELRSDSRGEKFLSYVFLPKISEYYRLDGDSLFDIWYVYQRQEAQEKLQKLSASLEHASLEAIMYAFLCSQMPEFEQHKVDLNDVLLTQAQLAQIVEIQADTQASKITECIDDARMAAKTVTSDAAGLFVESLGNNTQLNQLIQHAQRLGYLKKIFAEKVQGHFPVSGSATLPILFHAAASCDAYHYKACKLLVSAGADCSQNVEGIMPHHYALANYNKRSADYLYQAHQGFAKKQRALTKAIQKGNIEKMKLLLDQNTAVSLYHLKEAVTGGNNIFDFNECCGPFILLLNQVIRQGNLGKMLTQCEEDIFVGYGVRALPLLYHTAVRDQIKKFKLLIFLGAEYDQGIQDIIQGTNYIGPRYIQDYLKQTNRDTFIVDSEVYEEAVKLDAQKLIKCLKEFERFRSLFTNNEAKKRVKAYLEELSAQALVRKNATQEEARALLQAYRVKRDAEAQALKAKQEAEQKEADAAALKAEQDEKKKTTQEARALLKAYRNRSAKK